jgi:parallel beta-helix repeat protein
MNFSILSKENQMKTRSTISKFLSITFVLIFLVMVPLSAVSAAATIFVRPDGDDSNCDGSANVAYPGGGPGLACALQTIQQGIVLVEAGGTVYVAAGNYTEQITITKSLGLIGAGELSTTIIAPETRTGSVAQGSLIHDYLLAAYATTGTIDVLIEGFTFDIDSQNKTSGTDRLDGVFFRDVKDAGGTTAGLYTSTIHNYASTPDYESWGLAVYGDSLLTINDNIIHDYTRDGLLVVGDSLAANPNVTISGNTITGSTTPLNGINIQNVSAGAVMGNTVTGHTRSSPWAAVGIVLWTSTGITINDNHINGNFYGIDIADGSHNITVSDNQLTGNIKRSISLDNSDDNIVSGNTITGPVGGTDDVAIGLSNNATGNMIGGSSLVAGNTISMATSGSGLLYVVHLDGSIGTGSNTIRYNTITGGQRAVQLDGPPGATTLTTISNNVINNPAWGGITAYNNGDLVITNNTLTNAVRPLEFFGPINLTITGNTISNPTYDGINLGNFTGIAIISGNTIHGIVDNSGIRARVSGAGLSITGNTIYDISETAPVETPSYAGRGIQIDPTADGVNIDGNEVYNNSSFAGICIDTGATGAKINNNYIHDNLQGIAANEQTSEFLGNLISDNRWGIDLNSTGASYILRFNSITGNNTNPADSYGIGIWAGTADLENNWWGCNEGPTTNLADPNGCDIYSGIADIDPWLVLKLDAPSVVYTGNEYGVIASLTDNSVGTDTSGDGHVYDGIASLFEATLGSFNPTTPTSLSGLFSTVYTMTTLGTDHVCVTVDSEQVCSEGMSPLRFIFPLIMR